MTTEIVKEQSTELTILQRCVIALKADKRRAGFTELSVKSKEIVIVTNPAGRQECHAAAMRLVKARTELEAEGEEVRSDAVKFQRGIIALQKELVGIIEPEELRLKTLRDEYDAKIEADRTAKIRAEQARIEAEQAAAKKAEEDRLVAERAEIARRQAELDTAERKRVAEEAEARRKIEEEQRASRLKIEQQERDARLAREEADRKARQALIAAEAEAKAKREAEEALLKAERDKLEAAQRAADAKARQEREAEEAKQFQIRLAAEAKAKAERDAAEAIEREKRRQEADLLDAKAMLLAFKERFGRMKEFAGVTRAIIEYFKVKEAT